MKTILIILLSLITILGYSQRCEHSKIGIANKHSNGNVVVYPNQYNYIEYKDGYYELYIGDKDKESYEAIINVKYATTEIYSVYLYNGLLMKGGAMYDCSIETRTKLSEYTKGVANDNSIMIKNKYVINVYYWNANLRGDINQFKIVLIK
jgi:hypothetical protein